MDIFYYIKFFSAFVFVIALMLLLGAAARRFSAQGGNYMARVKKTRRLNIVEQRIIDSKHRLVLVQRDDVEHLLLIGAEHDFLVESSIKAKAQVKTQAKTKPASKSKAVLKAKKTSKPKLKKGKSKK